MKREITLKMAETDDNIVLDKVDTTGDEAEEPQTLSSVALNIFGIHHMDDTIFDNECVSLDDRWAAIVKFLMDKNFDDTSVLHILMQVMTNILDDVDDVDVVTNYVTLNRHLRVHVSTEIEFVILYYIVENMLMRLKHRVVGNTTPVIVDLFEDTVLYYEQRIVHIVFESGETYRMPRDPHDIDDADRKFDDWAKIYIGHINVAASNVV